MNPTILRLLGEAFHGHATTQDMEELTRLLVLKGYYTPPPIKVNKKERKKLLEKSVKKITKEERDQVLQDAHEAFNLAKKEGSPSEDTRIAASKSPQYAYQYAVEIDKAPCEETRTGACKDEHYTIFYARWEGANPALKELMCEKGPKPALFYAEEIQKLPCDQTREIASTSSQCAYEYAIRVDQGTHPVTRESALKNPRYAYEYALRVDKKPTDDTREAASRDSRYAFLYARFIDDCYHPVTWAGAVDKRRYRVMIGGPESQRATATVDD
ncbi:MAG: hypothetical protein GF334_11385 [Candidatus Altiarchaeales archaeon]|nr:hypothetical protein [Candidatus Altiarchaeales archaeon]